MEQLLTTGEMDPSRVQLAGLGMLVMDSLGAIEQFEKLATEPGDLVEE